MRAKLTLSRRSGYQEIAERVQGMNETLDFFCSRYKCSLLCRCLMEVNLISEPGPWSCRISLRFEFASNGERLPHDEIITIPFGHILTDIEDVELALRRAQVAILNPKRSTDDFLKMSGDELQTFRTPQAFASGTLKFSKNSVVVEISDEDGVALSFVDLPGTS